MQIRNAFKEFFCLGFNPSNHNIISKQSTSCWRASIKNAHVARVILENLRTTTTTLSTTTGSELQCTAQARLVNFVAVEVAVVSSTTSNKTDLKFRWTATSFSRGDGRRLFLNLLTVWELVNWKRSQTFWCTFIIMMVSYQMRNSFPCTMKSSWVFCCSKVNVRLSIEPICDLRIAKFSDAPQSLWLVINHDYTAQRLKR